jgi:hypothetical protein
MRRQKDMVISPNTVVTELNESSKGERSSPIPVGNYSSALSKSYAFSGMNNPQQVTEEMRGSETRKVQMRARSPIGFTDMIE